MCYAITKDNHYFMISCKDLLLLKNFYFTCNLLLLMLRKYATDVDAELKPYYDIILTFTN